MLNKKVFVIAVLAASFSFVGCTSADKDMHEKTYAKGEAKPASFWWPNIVDLSPLRRHSPESNPYGDKFNYAREFRKLNLNAVKADIRKTLKDSKDWWPADWGHYGPLFIRMAWHSAGTYRLHDGKGGAAGGQQRFEPLNSWPDNVSLDKARRLMWPVKKKYGRKISWADLMVLAGNVSMEDMGFKTFGYAGGRQDDWEVEMVYWGPETEWLAGDKRYTGKRKLEKPLAAVQMGLIYVNPEGPNGVPDPLAAAQDIRDTFGRMAMNDEETAALIAGGHTFGKAHGAHKASCLESDPSGAPIEQQGLGWKNNCGTGKGKDTITSGLEGAWSANPTAWTTQYLDNLYNFEWVLSKSPAGAHQWIPKNADQAKFVPDAHVKGKFNTPIMFTTDMALKKDPGFRKITMRFKENPKEFEDAFARAWFKLTHRDMGPRSRYLGKEAPKEQLIWQDPIPARKHALINNADAASLKSQILKSGLSNAELIRVAWGAAASYRSTDGRGGVNGARIRLAPQKDWPVNNPAEVAKVISALEKIQSKFNKASGSKKVSLADLIVLGGNAAIENAARKAGSRVRIPFKAGRMDASLEQTDVDSFTYLEPKADAFRNYYATGNYQSPIKMMIEKADTLDLSVPEMAVLIGGLRSLDANANGVKHGVLTSRPGALSNDFFVNLMSMDTVWRKSKTEEGLYEGFSRKDNTKKYTATPVDLVFGSHAELRAVSEAYAADDAKKKFLNDFVAAWNKVMNLDRM